MLIMWRKAFWYSQSAVLQWKFDTYLSWSTHFECFLSRLNIVRKRHTSHFSVRCPPSAAYLRNRKSYGNETWWHEGSRDKLVLRNFWGGGGEGVVKVIQGHKVIWSQISKMFKKLTWGHPRSFQGHGYNSWTLDPIWIKLGPWIAFDPRSRSVEVKRSFEVKFSKFSKNWPEVIARSKNWPKVIRGHFKVTAVTHEPMNMHGINLDHG